MKGEENPWVSRKERRRKRKGMRTLAYFLMGFTRETTFSHCGVDANVDVGVDVKNNHTMMKNLHFYCCLQWFIVSSTSSMAYQLWRGIVSMWSFTIRQKTWADWNSTRSHAIIFRWFPCRSGDMYLIGLDPRSGSFLSSSVSIPSHYYCFLKKPKSCFLYLVGRFSERREWLTATPWTFSGKNLEAGMDQSEFIQHGAWALGVKLTLPSLVQWWYTLSMLVTVFALPSDRKSETMKATNAKSNKNSRKVMSRLQYLRLLSIETYSALRYHMSDNRFIMVGLNGCGRNVPFRFSCKTTCRFPWIESWL